MLGIFEGMSSGTKDILYVQTYGSIVIGTYITVGESINTNGTIKIYIFISIYEHRHIDVCSYIYAGIELNLLAIHMHLCIPLLSNNILR